MILIGYSQTFPSVPNPEEIALQNIDAQLKACGWVFQDRLVIHLFAALGEALASGAS